MGIAKQISRAALAAVVLIGLLASMVFCGMQVAWADDESTSRVLTTTDSIKSDQGAVASTGKVKVFRLYNPRTGEHHYTTDANEKNVLKNSSGWTYEGVGWIAPKTGKPVYRLFNPKSGEHHYTSDAKEKNTLSSKRGWKYEGVCWYSDTQKRVAIDRLFQPKRKAISSHQYTTDANEVKVLTKSYGWKFEGAA